MEQREYVETDPFPNGFAREPGWEYQKPLRKTKTTKEAKAKTINNHWENQAKQNKTFEPMSPKRVLGPKVL